MEKREIILFVATFFSFFAFLFISISILSSSPSSYSADLNSLTGNVILNLDNFKIGDRLTGSIEIKDKDAYGVLSLGRNGEDLFAETFYLNNFAEGNLVKIEDLVDYQFEEKGDYELFFSVLKSDINLREKFTVE